MEKEDLEKEIELYNLVEIIQRKIWYENKKVYEYFLHKGIKRPDLVIPDYNFSEKKLKEAIEKNINLNSFGYFNEKKAIYSDLNMYLDQVKRARLRSLDSYIRMLNTAASVNDQIRLIDLYCDTHTEKENILIKKAFLKMYNYSEETIEKLGVDYLVSATLIDIATKTEENQLHF